MVTPGHTKGGMCWYLVPQFGNHEDGAPVLISGDTLFEGSVGRTDFEGGSMKEMRASLRKLAFLPDETIVASRTRQADHHRSRAEPHLRAVGVRTRRLRRCGAF